MSTAATEAGVSLGVLVDVNVGQNRCGVAPGQDAVEIGKRTADMPGLTLRGLMGYEGHAVGIPTRAEREAAVRTSMDQLVATARMFTVADLPTDIVSAGGTGSYDISSTFEEITEIQAGSYALMDSDYGKARNAVRARDSPCSGRSSAAPLRSVVSPIAVTRRARRITAIPIVKGIDGARVLALNDEHATIQIPASSTIRIGDRIELLPSHIDPTMNLHDVVYALEGENVIDVWPIAARGYAEHRR